MPSGLATSAIISFLMLVLMTPKCQEIIVRAYLLVDVPPFAGAGRHRPFAVAPFEQRHAGRLGTGVVLVVEEQVLIEGEPAQVPLAGIGALLVQVSADGVLHASLGSEVQQL